jgi:polyphenol oxidase
MSWTSRASSAEVGGGRSTPVAAALAHGVEAWFSGAHLEQPVPGRVGDAAASAAGVEYPVGAGVVIDGNLAHHRPHHPVRLAAARDAFARVTRTDAARWHLMRQVHGAEVGVVDADLEVGAELRGVDALVTVLTGRPLVVLAADCLPILLAGPRAIAAVHAGWRGLVSGVIAAAVNRMSLLGEDPQQVRAVIGPGIGPCCYEVGADVAAQVIALAPSAAATTRRGRRALDLRAAARVQLAALEVDLVEMPPADEPGGPIGEVGERGEASWCTSCGPGWFSHRRDPDSGRQGGLIVRSAVGAREGETHAA